MKKLFGLAVGLMLSLPLGAFAISFYEMSPHDRYEWDFESPRVISVENGHGEVTPVSCYKGYFAGACYVTKEDADRLGSLGIYVTFDASPPTQIYPPAYYPPPPPIYNPPPSYYPPRVYAPPIYIPLPPPVYIPPRHHHRPPHVYSPPIIVVPPPRHHSGPRYEHRPPPRHIERHDRRDHRR